MKKSVKNLLILGGIFGTTLAIGGSVALASCATSGSTTSQQANMGSINNGDLNGLKPGSSNKNNVEQNKDQAGLDNKQETGKNEDVSSTPSQPTQTQPVSPIQKPTTSGSSGLTTTGNNTVNKQEVTTQTGSKKATLLSRALAKAEVSNDTTNGSTEHTPVASITKTFASGNQSQKIWDNRAGKLSTTNVELYQSPYYYNQRDLMPILSTSEMYNYPNERTQGAVESNAYLGWWSLVKTTNFAGNFETLEYRPLDELREVYDTVKAGTVIKAARINLGSEYLQKKTIAEINDYLKQCADHGIEFVILENPSQAGLEKIVIPEGIKKLTIKDFNGNLKSLRGITINSTVQELEFYSTTANRIDPTILPDTTHMLYDHIDGFNPRLGQLRFKPFTMIDLSNQADLNNTKLQLAIDNVYGKRQYERNFQGDMVGGYIYQLDISNTPITSLNNVYIPSQSDGRFNIAYVQWSAGNNKGQVSVTIGGSNKYPGNDANVNEWFDASGWAEKATRLILNSDGKMFVDEVMVEFSALVKKYPNIVMVDVTDVQLMKSETQEGLAKKVLAMLGTKYAELQEAQKPTLTVAYLDANGVAKVMTNKTSSSGTN